MALFIDHLSSRAFRLEKELKTLRGVSQRVTALESRAQETEDILVRKDFSKSTGPLQVYRTDWLKPGSEDTFIDSGEFKQDLNYGALSVLKVGTLTSERTFRSLLRFQDFFKLPKKLQVVAARLHVRQIDNQNADDDLLSGELILLSVFPAWKAGKGKGDLAQVPEATWREAQKGTLPWGIPGVSQYPHDVNENIVATSGVGVQGDRSGAIILNFTQYGLDLLEDEVNWEKMRREGFLLRLAKEGVPNTVVLLGSLDNSEHLQRPFLEIFYVIPQGE